MDGVKRDGRPTTLDKMIVFIGQTYEPGDGYVQIVQRLNSTGWRKSNGAAWTRDSVSEVLGREGEDDFIELLTAREQDRKRLGEEFIQKRDRVESEEKNMEKKSLRFVREDEIVVSIPLKPQD